MLFYIWVYGWWTLNPTNYGWLATGDRTAHLQGWLFFRNGSWGFPLGRIDGILHPMGSAVAYTDSIPWVAVFFKLISPILPDKFQFTGFWMLSSYALQGVFGFLLLIQLGLRRSLALVGSVFFAISPALVFRGGHMALCAHWPILASLWLSLKASVKVTKKHLHWGVMLLVFISGVHPYLALMVFILLLPLPWFYAKKRKKKRWLTLALLLAGMVALFGATLFTFGYFHVSNGRVGGFGLYSANLLAFFNPFNSSAFLRQLPGPFEQYEGYGYLGCGIFFLLLCGLGFFKRDLHKFKKAAPLVLAVMALFILSLSGKIYLGAWLILDFSGVYNLILSRDLQNGFRSPGRFLWPLYYLIVAVAIAIVCRHFNPKKATLLLTLALILQLIELFPFYNRSHKRSFQYPTDETFQAPAIWGDLGKDYDRLAIIPPGLPNFPCLEPRLSVDEVAPFGFLAAREKMNWNSGQVARMNENETWAFCKSEIVNFTAGKIDERTIYVIPQVFSKLLTAAAQKQLACFELEKMAICVPESRRTKLRNRMIQ